MPITVIPVETPIPNSAKLPVVTPVNADSNGQLLDFTAATVSGKPPFGTVGCLTLRNAGPNPVFCMVNAKNPTPFPAAAVAAGSVAGVVYTPGVFSIQVNESVNFQDVFITSVGFICAGGQTALVETQAIKSGASLIEG